MILGALFRTGNLERSEHAGVGPNSNIKRGHAVFSKSPLFSPAGSPVGDLKGSERTVSQGHKWDGFVPVDGNRRTDECLLRPAADRPYRYCAHRDWFRMPRSRSIAAVLDKLPKIETHEHEPIEEAAKIIREMPNPPEIQYSGSKAFYSSITDQITLPPRELFVSAEEFYATALHETRPLCRLPNYAASSYANILRRCTLGAICRHNTGDIARNFGSPP